LCSRPPCPGQRASCPAAHLLHGRPEVPAGHLPVALPHRPGPGVLRRQVLPPQVHLRSGDEDSDDGLVVRAEALVIGQVEGDLFGNCASPESPHPAPWQSKGRNRAVFRLRVKSINEEVGYTFLQENMASNEEGPTEGRVRLGLYFAELELDTEMVKVSLPGSVFIQYSWILLTLCCGCLLSMSMLAEASYSFRVSWNMLCY
jgi:hypothetical protein